MLREFTQSLTMSLQNIKSNKMRSFLTMLGIIIGVGSVIGLITIVSAVTDSFMDRFASMGAGSITVTASGTALKSGLTDNDLETLREVEGVSGIAPTLSVSSAAVYDGTVYDKVSISGVDVLYFQHNNIIQSGRVFTEAEAGGDVRVCIVDQTFVKKVLHGSKDVIGTTFRLNGQQYEIIGLRKKSSSVFDDMTDDSRSDGTVIVPYRNAMNMAGAHNVTSVTAYYDEDAYKSTTVEEGLRTALKNMFNDKEGAYSVINMESIMNMMDQMKTSMTVMLGGIAGISLLVGGIGIMNMMLVSVTERTKEIGLRKALGAEPRRIRIQFLIESITLSLLGGILGILFGVLIGYVGVMFVGNANNMEIAFEVSSESIALGFGFSAAVGIIFGWAPASRASKLNPIDALRSE